MATDAVFDGLFAAYQAQANAEITRLRNDVAALAAQKREVEVENRRLWCVCGHLREAYGCLRVNANADDSEAADCAVESADALLAGLVPLTPAAK